MKQSIMIAMFATFTLVYAAINWYVFSKGYKALSGHSFQVPYTWVYWIIAASFVLGQVLERGNPGVLARFVTLIGSLWLVLFLYAILFFLFTDLIRLINHWTHFIPENLYKTLFNGPNYPIAAFGIGIILTIAGYINAANPIIKQVDLTLDKKESTLSELKVVLATDVHLGVLLQKKAAKKLVEDINKQKADLVLFGGDLVDHNPTPVIQHNLGAYLEDINSSLGVYAITGNHEYIGDANTVIKYLSAHKVKYIQDTILTLKDKIQLVGRNDREGNRYMGSNRKKASEILEQLDTNLPTILLDHQPVEYDEVAAFNVDLMLSGHTHRGQLWPLGAVTKRMFENDYGLYKKLNTYFYTSTGYGTWGPPVRIGNRPELVVFNIQFK